MTALVARVVRSGGSLFQLAINNSLSNEMTDFLKVIQVATPLASLGMLLSMLVDFLPL
jgi:hypothetical protein